MTSPRFSDRLSPAQVAKQLKCSADSVRLLCQTEQIDHEREGRKYWITQEQVDAYRARCIHRRKAS